MGNLAESYLLHGSNTRPNQDHQPAPKLLQRRSSYLGFFSPGRGWLTTVALDGEAGTTSWEESKPSLGSILWLSSSKTNLLIVMCLFFGCSSEPPSPSARAELSFSSFLGLLFLRAGDDGDACLGSTRSFWSSFEKAASESCALDRVLKAAFRVIIPMVVGVFRSCLQIQQTNKQTAVSPFVDAHPNSHNFFKVWSFKLNRGLLKVRTLHLKEKTKRLLDTFIYKSVHLWAYFVLLYFTDTVHFTNWRLLATLCWASLSTILPTMLLTVNVTLWWFLQYLKFSHYHICYDDLWSVVMNCWKLNEG